MNEYEGHETVFGALGAAEQQNDPTDVAAGVASSSVTQQKFGAGGTTAGLIGKVQAYLNNAGFGPITVDEQWGPATSSAVMAYQKDKSLPANGLLNPQTLYAMSLGPNPNVPAPVIPKTSPPVATGYSAPKPVTVPTAVTTKPSKRSLLPATVAGVVGGVIGFLVGGPAGAALGAGISGGSGYYFTKPS